MPNTILTYTAASTLAGTGPTQALAKLKSIFVDLTMPKLYGLLLISDTISNVSVALSRIIVAQMTATIADATGTAVMASTGSGAVQSVTVTAEGGLYGMPPVVAFSGGNPTRPAKAVARCKVRGCNVLLGGSLYSGATAIAFVGGLAPGGVAATATLTIVANVITAVNMVTAGGPYLEAPTCVVTDSGGGVGAEIVAGLSVLDTPIIDGGLGYQSVPTITYTPLPKAMLPDSMTSANQAATLQGWMDGAIQAGMNMPFATSVAAS